MPNANFRVLWIGAVLFVVGVCEPSPCQAGPLLDWLLGRYRRTPPPAPLAAPAPAPASTVAYYGPATNSADCGVCQRTVVNYAPQTYYHTTWVRVPVTQYRPVARQDPVTCCRVTYMQPCTTYSWQARRVPQTLYRPFLSRVTFTNPCCASGSAGLANSVILPPDAAAGYAPAGAPVGSSYVQPAAGMDTPAIYGGGFFQGPQVGDVSSVTQGGLIMPSTAPGGYAPAPNYATAPNGATTIPATPGGAGVNSSNPPGFPSIPYANPGAGATTAPAPGGVEPADLRPSLRPGNGGFPSSQQSLRPPSSSGNDWGTGAPSSAGAPRAPDSRLTPGTYGDGQSDEMTTIPQRPPAEPQQSTSESGGSAAYGGSSLFGPLPGGAGSSTVPPTGGESASSNPHALQPIPDPDAQPHGAAADPYGTWPAAPQLFDPRDRSASIQGAWGSVPAEWSPEPPRETIVSAESDPRAAGLTVTPASQVRPGDTFELPSVSAAVVVQPRSDEQAAPRRSPASLIGDAPSQGWRSANASPRKP